MGHATNKDLKKKKKKKMKELHNLKWTQHLLRISLEDDAGHFSITFKDTNSKTKIENMWESKVKDSESGWCKILTESCIL